MPRWLLALVVGISLAAGVPAPAHAEPPHTHEILYNRPSGFWTSNAPAIGGAYRYRLLLIGVGIAGITAYFVVRALRRANAERRQRNETSDAAPPSGAVVADRDAEPGQQALD